MGSCFLKKTVDNPRRDVLSSATDMIKSSWLFII